MRSALRRAGGLAFALSALCLGGAAQSADLGGAPARRPPPEPVETWHPAQIERWTGLYVGATYGYATGTTNVTGDSGDFGFDHSGGIGSLFAGYNVQLGNAFVVGAEADAWGLGNVSGDGTGFDHVSSELHNLFSLRGRAGFLLSPTLLVYGTGGFAWADYDFRAAGVTRSDTLDGFQVGGGAEFALSPRLTLRVEYIFTDLDSTRIDHAGIVNTYDPDFHTVRAGIAFKF